MWDLRKGNDQMDAKLVNPFVDAFVAVMPQMGFPEPKRAKMSVKTKNAISLGVAVIVGFTKQLRGNIVYNMSEDTAKFIASTMMMGMPVENFDEMAQSAISEMSNMLTANASINFSNDGINVDISVPTMMYGEEIEINLQKDNIVCIDFDVDGIVLSVNVALD